MSVQEVLLLAMTRMRSGICVAGMTREPDPVTGLRWVRPVRDFETVLPGDMSDETGCLFQCGQVVTLHLIEPRPAPPHAEDWLADFVHHRPRCVRSLDADRRETFFAEHLDQAPYEVLLAQKRSLCLVEPARVWASFTLDVYSGKYEARMGFALSGAAGQLPALSSTGASVTDLKWRALGREWLGEGGGLRLNQTELLARLNCSRLYLAVGLSRKWKDQYWPLVVGVHTVPDYAATVDAANL
ncbi:MAG: hypothetical protein JXA21_11015 [Anaerolineae bacterium]|nr:hypothetical protein [Anaerolineae bacterium]